MLQNEPSSTGGDGRGADAPASQRRVTAKELTSALTSLRVRKEEATRRQEEEGRRLAETIPIGQSVEELSLEATPEEIWAEVQAQRAQDDAAHAHNGGVFSCPGRAHIRQTRALWTVSRRKHSSSSPWPVPRPP